ncbi:MAG: putative transcriptional regulator, TetR family [Capsulimonas sp.]|jgi:AcrR family transcriptional regulator|nr:putative transcriptional regulator, TetR family [Capsulimonas sp.]
MLDECSCLKAASQESRGDKRRRELVSAAYRLIEEKGFEGLRVRDVAAAAGVNIATLHYYFPDKEDLIRGVIEHIVQEFISDNAPIVHNTQMSAADQMQAVIANLENRVRDHAGMCVVLNEITSRAHRDASIHETLVEMEAGWRAHLSALIAAGHADGSIPPSTDAAVTASVLTAMIRGLIIQAVYRLDKPDFQTIAKLVRDWIGGTRK